MRKTKKLLKRIIEEFKTTHIVGVVCQKVNISRQTFYRWCEDDSDFKNQAKEAQKLGIENICDIAESQMMKQIQQGSIQMIKFCLQNNRRAYFRKDRLTKEEKEWEVKKISINIPCSHQECGHRDKIIDVT